MASFTPSRPPMCDHPGCPAIYRRGRRLYVRAADNVGYVPAGWVCRGGHAIRVVLPEDIAYHAPSTENPEEDANQRLGRLFRNSELFFWGVFDKNQPQVYRALVTKYGLDFRRGTYGEVSEDLVASYGGRKLREIALDELKSRLGDGLLERLERWWKDGRWPTSRADLGGRDLQDLRGLLDVDMYWDDSLGRPTYFVRGWGVFAPVLFEFGTASER